MLIFMTVWYVKMESISQFSRQFHFCLSKSVLCLWYHAEIIETRNYYLWWYHNQKYGQLLKLVLLRGLHYVYDSMGYPFYVYVERASI